MGRYGLVLFSEDALKIGNQLFLFAKNLNILFSVNIDNGNIKFYGSMPEEGAFCKRLTCKLVYWEKNIIVVPLKAKKIWIYSLENMVWKGIAFDCCKLGISETNFRQAIIYKNSLFLFGGHYPAILKMELSTYKISYIKEPFSQYPKVEKNPEELYFRGDLVCKKNIVYLASSKDNLILNFDLESQTYKWIEVGGKNNKYSGIMWDGNNYWISPRHDTPVVKWNGKDKAVEYEIPKEKKKRQNYYSGVVGRDHQVIIPAMGDNSHTIILANDGTMKFDNRAYTFYKKIGKKEYIAQYSDGKLIYINGVERKEFNFNISENDFDSLLDAIHFHQEDITDITKTYINENVPFSLTEFMKLLQRVEFGFTHHIQNKGKNIWERLEAF